MKGLQNPDRMARPCRPPFGQNLALVLFDFSEIYIFIDFDLSVEKLFRIWYNGPGNLELIC